ncbi:ATP-binding cassette domain-containing protein [Actinomyces minihominis]|uniref:ATP-binding cassette domain-containing protein n=1 Tax=Actinomyces minihominis TaxID=2002838 RepID=UPI000C06C250|nr:ATP-binding cassette domain-containing protein [Actinomyces minihominis]
MHGPTIDFQHLSKNFGKVEAVSDLSFTVKPGRVTGFLGPNGAGKTTTLRMLLNLVRPTSGTATFDGRDYYEIEQPMLEVGAHLSADDFTPGRSGRDHLRVMAAGSGVGEGRIDELLALVGLTRDAGRRVGGYSLGMRQRLGLATALLGDPNVLILDEPANGLDPEGISWLRKFLRTLAEEGRTVFLSSHLLNEIQLMAHDIVIIDGGRLVASGQIDELENMHGSVVLADSTRRDALRDALTVAGFSVIEEPGAPLRVSGATIEDVGNLAVISGIPLTHLSEENTGLEDLFLSMVGGDR